MKTHARCGSERGTVLIQVAIAILSLTAFSAFVLDYGVLWVSRNQAQNAADAGALAGAIARGFDETTDPPSTGGKAELSAKWAARCASGSASCPTTPSSANPIWPSQAGASSGVEVLWECPPTFGGRCVRVNVYRDGTNGSTTLPAFFGPLLGISSQGIRATASARVANANATNCMRPFSIADEWDEQLDPPNHYNRYDATGNVLPGVTDQYIPASSSGPGTGYRLPRDYGVQKTLKGAISDPNTDPILRSWSLPVQLPDGAGGYRNGGDNFREDIGQCNPNIVKIGDYLPLQTGDMVGPTLQGFSELTLKDPTALWDAGAQKIQGSCAPGMCPTGRVEPVSPRIIPIPVWDIDEFAWRRLKNDYSSPYVDANGTTHVPTSAACGSKKCVRVTNILGFFPTVATVVLDAKGMEIGVNITGYLVTRPGIFSGTAPELADTASFVKVIQLIR
jgi:hypothetical protein